MVELVIMKFYIHIVFHEQMRLDLLILLFISDKQRIAPGNNITMGTVPSAMLLPVAIPTQTCLKLANENLHA